jgi:hypothetical protein
MVLCAAREKDLANHGTPQSRWLQNALAAAYDLTTV